MDRRGQTRKVRTYTIKYKDAEGVWVTEPTRATQRHVALRLLFPVVCNCQMPGKRSPLTCQPTRIIESAGEPRKRTT